MTECNAADYAIAALFICGALGFLMCGVAMIMHARNIYK